MYHVGRPGEDGYANRVLQAWGLDGHNSHTNVCSSSARLAHFLWTGADRPSPDHANARTILLLSSHLESGHYFNPHAQRIIEGKSRGARLIVIDPRLSNTSAKADMWLPANPGTEAALLLAIARELLATGRYNREFVRRWVNWDAYLEAAQPDLPAHVRVVRSGALKEYAQFTPEYAEAETGVGAAQVIEAAERRGGRRHRVLHAQLARRGRRTLVGLADHALPVPARRADGRDRRTRRRESPRHQQVRAEASESAAGAGLLERAALPEGVSARVLRDELPAAALPERGPRQARHVFHARLQPAVDESRRLYVDGSAAGRIEDRHARGADADLERNGVVRRLHPADGSRHRTPRHDEPGNTRRTLARIPPAGDARGDGKERREGRRHARGQPRRSLGRVRVLDRAVAGRSIRTDRSASGSSSSRPTGPAKRSRSTSTTAGSSRTRSRVCRRPRRRKA